MEKTTLSIPGITCDHCVRTIKNELLEVAGVAAVEGDSTRKTVAVEFETPATLDRIRQVLKDIDYPAQ